MKAFFISLLGGIAFVLFGILSIRSGAQKKKRCTESAVAMIVEIQVTRDSKKSTYTPVLEFVADGKTIQRRGNISSHKKREFKVGDTVSVKYNPDDPGEFLENGKSYGIGFGGILIGLGLVAIVGAFTQL